MSRWYNWRRRGVGQMSRRSPGQVTVSLEFREANDVINSSAGDVPIIDFGSITNCLPFSF